ncbi:hypothetical protein TYRP_015086 [Tyrophagus putrescentiae]|nr:hypothetical protein TYRP_015086 [Tyrophagus putrescentiae]
MDEQIKQKQQQRQQKSDGQILKELYGLVFIRGAEITPKKISNRYQRPISQANKLLEDFLAKYGHGQNNNTNKPLKVRYEFAGSKPKNGVRNLDFESHSLSLIDDTELEQKKSEFASCSYRPVSVHLASKKSPDPVLFFTQLRSPAKPTIESLKKVQSLSNVLNPHIKIRPPFRPLTIKTAADDGKAGSKSKADDAMAANSSSKKPKPMTTITTGEPMDIDKPGPSTSNSSYLSSTLLKPSKYFSSSSIGSSSASTSSAKQQQKATSTSSLLKKRPILEQPSSAKDDKDKESSSTSTANTFTALKASAPPAKKAKKGPSAKSSKVLDSLADPCEKLRAEKRLTEQANFTVKKSGGGGNALQTSTTSKPVNKKNGPTAEVVSTAGKSTGQQSILSFFARKKIN